MDRRLFTTILVLLGLMIFWQTVMPKVIPSWFPQPQEPQEVGPAPGTDGAGTIEAPKPEATAGAPEEPAAAPAGTPTERPAEQVVLENTLVRAVFTTRGAALESWELKGERFTRDGQQVDLVNVGEGQPNVLATTFEELEWTAGASYEVVSRSDREVVFRATGGGVTVEKRYRLADERYHLGLELAVEGAQGQLTPTIHVPRFVSEARRPQGGFMQFGVPDVTQAACGLPDDVERREHDPDEQIYAHTGPVQWAGIDERYFLTAVFPGVPAFIAEEPAIPSGTCTLQAPKPYFYDAELTLSPMKVGAGQASVTLTAFLGPKFKTVLGEYGHGLSESIDFGLFTVLSLALLWVMILFNGIFGNWGVAIIFLTIVVKLVLFPLTTWSMKSMERMRAVQPKVKALKEKHGKNKEQFQIKMMELYREEKVNPFGGCLPMLLQFPIWIALYRTILNTAELYNAEFIPGWLPDLSAAEPGLVKVLPLLMGVTMWGMQRMTPTPETGDENQVKMQKFMQYFMPPFFTFIMYGLPSGLTLYIFVNNLLSIAQQLWIRKQMAKTAPAGA